jgi:hypothetical protein
VWNQKRSQTVLSEIDGKRRRILESRHIFEFGYKHPLMREFNGAKIIGKGLQYLKEVRFAVPNPEHMIIGSLSCRGVFWGNLKSVEILFLTPTSNYCIEEAKRLDIPESCKVIILSPEFNSHVDHNLIRVFSQKIIVINGKFDDPPDGAKFGERRWMIGDSIVTNNETDIKNALDHGGSDAILQAL